jgi:hypothetical protein
MDARNEKTLSKATPLRIAAEHSLTAAHKAEEEHQEAIQKEIRKTSYAMGLLRRLFGLKLLKADKEGTDAGSPKATKTKSATPAESLDAATKVTATAKTIAA